MTLLSTVCRFLIPAKQDGYLPGSTFSNVANFVVLKRFAGRREGLTASLFYNPNSPHPLYSKNCGLPFLTESSGKIIFKVPPNYLKLAKSTHKSTFQ